MQKRKYNGYVFPSLILAKREIWFGRSLYNPQMWTFIIVPLRKGKEIRKAQVHILQKHTPTQHSAGLTVCMWAQPYKNAQEAGNAFSLYATKTNLK